MPEKGFIFSQIKELTINIYSSLSNENISYYLKFRIPIMHIHFLEKSLKIVNTKKNICFDLNNLFRFCMSSMVFI